MSGPGGTSSYASHLGTDWKEDLGKHATEWRERRIVAESGRFFCYCKKGCYVLETVLSYGTATGEDFIQKLGTSCTTEYIL